MVEMNEHNGSDFVEISKIFVTQGTFFSGAQLFEFLRLKRHQFLQFYMKMYQQLGNDTKTSNPYILPVLSHISSLKHLRNHGNHSLIFYSECHSGR